MSADTTGILVREATADDADILHGMIVELAVFERLQDTLHVTVEALRAELAAEDGVARALVAEIEGEPVGMAIFFPSYATFAGGRGLYLEDIYVKEGHRGRGVGTALLRQLASTAIAEGSARIEWTTLAWNTAAIEFYESIGASPNDAWTTYRLTGSWLQKLADG